MIADPVDDGLRPARDGSDPDHRLDAELATGAGNGNGNGTVTESDVTADLERPTGLDDIAAFDVDDIERRPELDAMLSAAALSEQSDRSVASMIDPLMANPALPTGLTGQIVRPGDETPAWLVPMFTVGCVAFIALLLLISS